MTQSNVLVLTKPDCQGCIGTRRMLRAYGIEFDEVDLTVHQWAFDRATELGHQQAPVVIVTDQFAEVTNHWSGMRPDRIKEIA